MLDYLYSYGVTPPVVMCYWTYLAFSDEVYVTTMFANFSKHTDKLIKLPISYKNQIFHSDVIPLLDERSDFNDCV